MRLLTVLNGYFFCIDEDETVDKTSMTLFYGAIGLCLSVSVVCIVLTLLTNLYYN